MVTITITKDLQTKLQNIGVPEQVIYTAIFSNPHFQSVRRRSYGKLQPKETNSGYVSINIKKITKYKLDLLRAKYKASYSTIIELAVDQLPQNIDIIKECTLIAKKMGDITHAVSDEYWIEGMEYGILFDRKQFDKIPIEYLKKIIGLSGNYYSILQKYIQ